MITISVPSVSENFTFEETLSRLRDSKFVDGMAEFGSHAKSQARTSSDYDLLVLVKDIPARVFQMLTTIDGHLADIVLVEAETADALLNTTELTKQGLFESLFVQKMQTAHILYDASGRLQKVKQWIIGQTSQVRASNPKTDSDLYAAWFWQSFGLLHLERMAQSQDPVHLSAVDMMLTACLSGTWQSYFDVRGIPWEGEKAAIRYWKENDMEYLAMIRKCLEIPDRRERLENYRKAVEHTLAPIGKVFDKGQTAVILANQNNSIDVQTVLNYWHSLFGL